MPDIHSSARRGRWSLFLAVCALALAVLTACGSSGSSGSSGGAEPSASASGPAAGSGAGSSSDAVIMIEDFAFTTPDSVSPGATITVDNKDGTAHTVTSDSGGDFDVPAPSGKTTFTAPTKPGTYKFHCNIHPEMHGTLVVK